MPRKHRWDQHRWDQHRRTHLCRALCALALLGPAPPPLRAQAPEYPSAGITRVVERAFADEREGRYAEALARLRAAPPAAALPADVRVWQRAVADVETEWGAALLSGDPDHFPAGPEAARAKSRALRSVRAADRLCAQGLACLKRGPKRRPLRGGTPRTQSLPALRFYGQALALYREAGSHNGEVAALDGLGTALLDVHQYPKAAGFLRQAQAVRHQARNGYTNGVAVVFEILASAAIGLGHYPEAAEYAVQALPITLKDVKYDADIAPIPALAREALGIHRRARAFCRQSGDRDFEESALEGMADAYKALGQPRKALRLRRQAGDRGYGFELFPLGDDYCDLGRPREALRSYRQALAGLRHNGRGDDEAAALDKIGDLFLDCGQYHEALGAFRRAVAVVRQEGRRDGGPDSLDGIARVYMACRQYRKAIGFSRRALAVFQNPEESGPEVLPGP